MEYHFPDDGFAILRNVFSPAEIAALIDALSEIGSRAGVRSRGGVYAIRALLEASAPVRELANSPKLDLIVSNYLGAPALPVRGTLFDKTPRANWLVPWHQDRTICVDSRREVEGFGPWTRKAGVWHVQPPALILEGMLSVRIHLDDSDERNGALRVLRGTHRVGRLTVDEIAGEVQAGQPVTCAVGAGDVVLMRPLILHASSASAEAAHRRVIHLDYAGAQLPGGLRWRASELM